jgi:hypothetical protein
MNPITNKFLKRWEQAGGKLAKAAREIREKESEEMTTEIITGGWCEGDKIIDDVIISRRTGKPAFQSKFNADAVEQLRRHHMTREVSE